MLSADSDLKVETNEDGACTETAGWPDQDESRLLKWKKALQGERNLRQMLLVNREILRNLQNKRAEDMVARRQLRKWLVTELSKKPNGKDNDNTKDTLPKPIPRKDSVYRANWRVLEGRASHLAADLAAEVITQTSCSLLGVGWPGPGNKRCDTAGLADNLEDQWRAEGRRHRGKTGPRAEWPLIL